MDVSTLTPEVQEYINQLENRYTALEEKYKLLLFQKYGRKSEKEETNPDQQLLFVEESTAPESEEVKTITVNSHPRKKRGRKPIDDSLPREEVIVDIPEDDKHCACGHDLVRIGEETSEQLHVIPPRMWVQRTIRPQYACKKCEGSGDEDKPAVRIAAVPPAIIPKSIATPGLLAFLLVNKFVDHLPYYRQQARFERIGVQISRQNMSNWQMAVFEKIKPLLELLKIHLKTGPVIKMDETTVQVLGEPERENTTKSYMWLARGGPPDKPVVLYSYRETRAAKHIDEFIDGFKGYLQTDGYEAYNTALKGRNGIIHVGCMAHARRKFFEAMKASKKTASANEGLKYIKKLYAIESQLRGQDLEQNIFLEERRTMAEPILLKFKTWLEKKHQHVLPSSLLGKAISYTLNEWEKLISYLDSPYLTPDNNASEQAIRPFVLGRKNWLFSGSPAGAESSCGMYSLIETAKQNNLNPHTYLMTVFERTPLNDQEKEWNQLLPWNIDL